MPIPNNAAPGDVLLEVKDLEVHYVTRDMGDCHAVGGVSFAVNRGETLGLVGETGAGKTTVALSIMGLIPMPPGQIRGGRIEFNGRNLLELNNAAMRKVRGKQISMIFQDPMTALNPIDRVGDQVAEVILLHQKTGRREAVKKAGEMLELVGIPAQRYHDYPHQFSGGMKQRVVIAIALACSPGFLIADEPTTALDVTIQAQVLDMMDKLKRDLDTSMLLITHDLGVVAEMCDKVAIMYAGMIVEYGTAEHIFNDLRHPYTKGLFDSLPDAAAGSGRLRPIRGQMPDPANLPPGCKFAPRCERCLRQCRHEQPGLTEIAPGHFVRCFLARESEGDGHAATV